MSRSSCRSGSAALLFALDLCYVRHRGSQRALCYVTGLVLLPTKRRDKCDVTGAFFVSLWCWATMVLFYAKEVAAPVMPFVLALYKGALRNVNPLHTFVHRRHPNFVDSRVCRIRIHCASAAPSLADSCVL